MSRIRTWVTVEIDRTSYTCQPVEVHPALERLGVGFVVAMVRRDGTEPVVVAGTPTGVACSCNRGVRDRWCPHVEGLVRVGILKKPEAVRPSQLGFFGALAALANPAGDARMLNPASGRHVNDGTLVLAHRVGPGSVRPG